MRRVTQGALALLLAAGVTGTAVSAVQAVQTGAPAQAGDVAVELKKIRGLTVEEKTSNLPGYRWFWLKYKQPVDHRRPNGQWFEQRIMLQHKAESRPMVLYTSGYHTPETMFRSEPTALVDGNQVSVEYRYFSPSRPVPTDWKKDTIWQAATDEHRIIRELKRIYKAKWISTGASKGGMTAVYHKRFYPRDVDGSVVYVAPNNVNDREDSAYDRFFASVGSDAKCRAQLKDVAREFLKRRPAMLKRFEADAAKNGWTFKYLRSMDRAFENSVMDYEWGFWQYKLQSDCGTVPAVKASDDELYKSLDEIAGLSFYTDQGLDPYLPYYYQAGYELGAPNPKFKHLRPYLRYESTYNNARAYLPSSIPVKWDGGKAMRDIDKWVRTKGTGLMFIYGANDPWRAEPFRLGKGSRDSYYYVAPGMNHSGRLIDKLPAEHKSKAIADLLRWANVSSTARTRSTVPSDAVDPLQLERPKL
ncbi:S28 family serine protease [Spirillospora sp. CA-294931]|uniref:S28 family serine protease n=1 Tax=Spirillospora sp. CA-294931 TaxID=3240042 RepID=UPI003D8F7BB4